ncbi:PREDICTED: pentatricopeptide repeat-containing protein At3g63370, chloroplastic [Tarenaya hassleriana]|uniref:pentatricopeptide repeat-containing protein At3g63370, chloroplastic n=1 Tax=Tarenaya hassleriana TaxID=28532 RepID=UPI00053C626D|nr:PREDICTED: pentatricopeptide repeat-containing protein At3g63370, chloroplastic [Tarenaya hassleriana]XP_010545108.1 PREDICTED: pentatricopeptide repeat-containing protein At3g63370, chloroplastic [Tarenaya hassleriana]XP_010545109.1 PREDICTED: pentatricopeptide repeat-containing protein At3g63370, chloroplastic [Tarenaya hassleriana]XP_010545110.1 PREDICTED: pentatricopeptide repeat-containing protein At3g63370, chloroplastic [Tarenaya hassleriana]XP_010545111.1 PREDICTED: pentatricopeptide
MYSASSMATRACCSIPTEPSYRPRFSHIRRVSSLGNARNLVPVPPSKPQRIEGGFDEASPSLGNLFSSGDDYPDQAYASLLDLCGSRRSLSQVRQLHARISKICPFHYSGFLGGKLVFVYGKCGSLDDAEKVFDRMRVRTSFAWNAMIGAYVSNNEPGSALGVYRQMLGEGVPVHVLSFPLLLKACAMVGDLKSGTKLHGLVVKLGYCSTIFVVNALISMYAKNADLNAARRLFDRSEDRDDVVMWNSVISSYSASGQSLEALGFFREMQMNGPAPNSYTFVSALTACEDPSHSKLGKEIHSAVLKSSHSHDVYVCNALIAMYARCSNMVEAGRILSQMDENDIVSWNSMIVGFVHNCMYTEAFAFLRDMMAAGHNPDEVSMTSVIAASGRSGNLLAGMESHAYVIKFGLDYNLQVGNTLIDMYSKCSCTDYMGRTFYLMPDKDMISWTTIISGYAQNDCHTEALGLFRVVAQEQMESDAMMLGSVLLACSKLKCMLLVKEIHGYILRKGLYDTVTQNAIVDVYGECGSIDYAIQMFELMEDKDVVSWTSVIFSCVNNGKENEAVELFHRMVETGTEADSVALVGILSAAASLSALKIGLEVHGCLLRKGFCLEGSTASALIDMYARCGDLQSARAVYDLVERKGLVQYTSMVNAYGMHGHGDSAVELFAKMKHGNIIPDHIAFLALLYACSHAGLTDEGRNFIEIMEHEYNLVPWPEHYACLVDMLGRSNCVTEAYEFVKSMKTKPTAEVWCALLAACRAHSEKEIGEVAAQKLLELDPKSPGNLVLVSNVFAEQGRWEDVEAVRAKLKASGLKKHPGCSWIEIDRKIHAFMARDKSHTETNEIYNKLSEIIRELEREMGYAADTKFVLHDVDEKEKVQILHGHSERLAIAYGLLKTPEGARLRITKNLRVCSDCHTFCKLVSKLFRRQLVIRDANRFHHFENGACSCGDFW